MKNRNRKYTKKNIRKQRGGQEPPDKIPSKYDNSKKSELGGIIASSYIDILEFIKNKLARFAGLKPVQEEKETGPSLAETAEQGAAAAINGLNVAIQNPAVKRGVALASEQLINTLSETAKVAKEKIDNPEFQETLLILVKFIANMVTKFVDAISPALDRTVDKYAETFERVIRKIAIAIANAIMDFLQALPVVGGGVAFISLLHTIAMFIFALLEAFYKTMQTSANFVAEVADNLNPRPGSNDGFMKIKNALQPSIENYSNIAKTKYQDIKSESLKPTNVSVPIDAPNAMKGGKKRIQKRIRKSIRDFLKNQTRKHRKR